MTYTLTKTETATNLEGPDNITTNFVDNGYIGCATAEFITNNVKKGDRAILTNTTSNNGDWLITHVLSETEIIVDNAFNIEAAAGEVEVKQNNFYLTINDEVIISWQYIYNNCPEAVTQVKMKKGLYMYTHCLDYINITHSGATSSGFSSRNEIIASVDISDATEWSIKCADADPGKTILRIGTKGNQEMDVIVAKAVADLTDGTYFTIQGISGDQVTTDYYAWLDLVGDSSGDPAPAGKTEIRIDLSGETTLADVRDAMIATFDAQIQFISLNYLGLVIIGRTDNGNVTNMADVDTGLTMTPGSTPGTGGIRSVRDGSVWWGYTGGGATQVGNLHTKLFGSFIKGDSVMIFGSRSSCAASILATEYAYIAEAGANKSIDLWSNMIYCGSNWGPLIYNSVNLMEDFLIARSGDQAPINASGIIEGLQRTEFTGSPVFWLFQGPLTCLNPKEAYTTNQLFTSTIEGVYGYIAYTWKPKFVFLNEVDKNFEALEGVEVYLGKINASSKVETEITESPFTTDVNGYIDNSGEDFIDLIQSQKTESVTTNYRFRCRATHPSYRKLEWIFDITEKQEDVEIVMTKFGTDYEGEYST